ncbi:conserved hypothetical protein [Thermoproteus tenax Kra 1]|uniref:DUF1616 domain-containing protein n=1 Tax=Thermoproteus tenax (strain ATCC 35583 / DSM 2078 / JCM 9277 / NBRC 100435 / Kra 1) TaxID=768679 RepID=G4RKA6_THETK|nr:conserved hypothetical protein [Thermoproteus tenax Kra 1]
MELEGAPRSAIAYIFSIESAWYWLSIALVAASVFVVTLVTEPPLIYVRYILGALMLLFLPGYAIVETLYPRGDELSPLERLALAIGLSFAVLPLIGLALNYTPWGIGLGPVLISTNALTIALLTTALVRKVKIFRMRAHSYPHFCS